MPLTDLRLRTLKYVEGEKTRIPDSGGLSILLRPSGGRLWQMRYQFQGKRRTLSFGSYPKVSLAEARRRRDQARDKLEEGIDPAEPEVIEASEASTFRQFARDWLAKMKPSWTPTYYRVVKNRLDRYLLPFFGDKPIDKITAKDVLAPLRDSEDRGTTELPRRLLIHTSAVFRYAVAEDALERDPTADLRGALKAQPEVKHRTALPLNKLQEFFIKHTLSDAGAIVKLAVRFTILTAARTDEVRFCDPDAEFEDLDGSDPVWRIPGARMKMKKEHVVPLSPQAVEVIREALALRGDSRFLFPGGARQGVMSENTMLYSLYRAGYHQRATIHGFRGMFSSAANEADWNADWIERQLAHVPESEVRRAYNSAKYLPGRRRLMNWWGALVAKHYEAAALLG